MAHYLSQRRIEDPIWLGPNDISLLQSRISEAETAARRFDNQIEELRAQIYELTRQKDGKLAEITSLRNVLAHVRRAPLEILLNIFELLCLPEGPYYIRNHNLVPTMFTLSGVCAAWRNAAHATPRLWCKLDISLISRRLGSDFVWVDGWITRCQGLPLEFHLSFNHMYRDQRGTELLEYILAHFSRKIRVLDLFGSPTSCLPPILQLPQSSFLSLERLSLCPIDSFVDTVERVVKLFPSKVEVFLSSPKLREVDLRSVFLMELLPAEQLTSLKLKGFDRELAVFWDVLSRCKNLVSLDISLPPLSSGNHILSLPALKSLSVTCVTTRNFLCHLTAPLLEKLFIIYNTEILDQLVNDLTAFQQRSATQLSSLSLWHQTSDSKPPLEKEVRLFSSFPTIHTIKLRSYFDVNPFIRAITCTEGYQVLPNLKHLTLRGSIGHLDASELKSMVLSRWWPDRSEGVSVSDRNGLCRLRKVTVRELSVQGSVEDITNLSALPGFILDYTPTEHES